MAGYDKAFIVRNYFNALSGAFFGNTISGVSISTSGKILSAGVDLSLIFASQNNTASWNAAYTTLTANSASWNNTTVTVIANSASWNAAYTTLTVNSGNWNNTTNVVNANSASWNSTTSTVNANSSNWNTSYTILTANSASWNSTTSTVNTNSANWGSSYTILTSNSASWNNTTNVVNANSASWNSTTSTVNTNSANWDTSYTTITANSASWGSGSGNTSVNAAVTSNSANWNTSYTTLTANSANWNSTYATVTANSGNYILNGGNDTNSSLTLGTNSNFDLDFKTNNVTGMKFSRFGQLGIGTTTPVGKLHINDTIHAGSSGLSDPALNITQTWNTSGTPVSFSLNVTDLSSNANSSLLNLSIGGASLFRIAKSGNIIIPANARLTDNTNSFVVRDTTRSSAAVLSSMQGMKFIYGSSLQHVAEFINNGWLNLPTRLVITNPNAGADLISGPRWTLAGNGGSGEFVVFDQSGNPGHLCLGNNNKLMWDANNAFGVRNGTNAQTFSIYRTFTNSTTYERLVFKSSAGNNIIGAETSPGSATWRNIEFQTLTATRMSIKTNGSVNFAGISTDPTVNSAGDVYYNSTFNSLKLFDGTAFVPVNTTRTIATFTALENHPVSANFATLNTRNFDNVGVLQFAAGSPIREARFISVIPDNAVLANGLLIRTQFSTITATSGSCRWGAQIKKLSSTSYAASAGIDVTVSGTANQTTMTGTITLPSIDSLAPGDAYALRIFRESSNVADTLVDSAQLLTVEVRTNI